MMRFRGDGPGFQGPRSGGRGFMRGERGEPGKHIEGRIAFLKAELKITEAQTRAWDQYATFMRDTAKTRQAAAEKREADMKAMRAEPGKRPERKALLARLEENETRARAMLQSIEKRKAATQALYKALSDEQKKLAEDLL
ncbi:MAG: Spy/CpxP family protein refolding chaperone [Rhodospirillaceae bacterium]